MSPKSPDDYGGQRRNMEDDSMRGTLHYQALAVWPLEREILARRVPTGLERVLDLACGTGRILPRFREFFEPGILVGVDLYRGHLTSAEPPVAQADGYALPFAAGTFDLVLVRHVLQALNDPVAIMREAHRVLKPGGRVHLLVEDYAGMIFDIEEGGDVDYFAQVTPLFRKLGTDLYQGRRAYRQLREAGYEDVTVDPFVVDTLNADRETLAGIFRNWRDGYAATLAQMLDEAEEELRRRFDLRIEACLDPERYCAWLLFVVQGVRPA